MSSGQGVFAGSVTLAVGRSFPPSPSSLYDEQSTYVRRPAHYEPSAPPQQALCGYHTDAPQPPPPDTSTCMDQSTQTDPYA
eukprot:9641272-Karenia_brevis.AAC.1